MRVLQEKGLLLGKGLDFGCGFGKDADVYRFDKYDTTHFPFPPTDLYDTITCNYVLNVNIPELVPVIIDRVSRLLKKGGSAYFTVRRDLKRDGWTSKGTYQHTVKLDLPVVFEDKGCCIYRLIKQ